MTFEHVLVLALTELLDFLVPFDTLAAFALTRMKIGKVDCCLVYDTELDGKDDSIAVADFDCRRCMGVVELFGMRRPLGEDVAARPSHTAQTRDSDDIDTEDWIQVPLVLVFVRRYRDDTSEVNLLE